ncbi:hypothetical protein ILFOPFJJ_06965 [Ensifer psoraleae]|nr:hypothetical protein [Sinorhizobium psoraleae]
MKSFSHGDGCPEIITPLAGKGIRFSLSCRFTLQSAQSGPEANTVSILHHLSFLCMSSETPAAVSSNLIGFYRNWRVGIRNKADRVPGGSLMAVVKLVAVGPVRLVVLFEVGSSTASSWRWIGLTDPCGVRGYWGNRHSHSWDRSWLRHRPDRTRSCLRERLSSQSSRCFWHSATLPGCG